jgi:hypothetical protein
VGELTYTMHPLGFVRAELIMADGRLARTHYWPEAGFMDTDRHQHGDDFDSTLLQGEIVERLFRPQPDPNGSHELWPVVCYSDTAGTYHVDADLSRVVRVTPILIDELHYSAGDTYHRARNDYHQVEVVKAPVVTMSVWGPRARTRSHFFMRSTEHPESLYQQGLLHVAP